MSSPRGLTIVGALFLALLAVAAIAGPLLAGDPNAIDNMHWVGNPIAPGVGGHLLGSDENGRDLAARVAFGLRTSFAIALGAAAIATFVGYLLGLLIPQRRVWRFPGGIGIWGLTMFPFVTLAVLVLRAYGAAADIIIFGIALAPVSVLAMLAVRTVRARIGVFFGLTVAAVMLNVPLSQTGGGVQPPVPDLGNILVNAMSVAFTGPWVFVTPAVVIFMLLFSLNAISDGLLAENETAGR